ncbi:glucokinase regulator family [Cordyceps militaris]|uniref:N-acetyl-D-glucosamine kinase n=1 Tax=Cordyceps militaris TaxID=73501 RepID=A0A2H4SA39_CORMI|nr:glucokinase regulator family [Cordyceps militaris]
MQLKKLLSYMEEPGHDQMPTLGTLQTEAIGHLAQDMDTLSTLGLCQAFHREESQVPAAIAPCLPTIALLIDAMLPRLRAGGRLLYVGAGNSGRIAHMDCAELHVTFSVSAEQCQALVAGGPRAVLAAVEGAEDSRGDGEAQMEALRPTARDTVIGVAASGRTPFVLGALQSALRAGALTAAVTSARPAAVERLGVGFCIAALAGPEFVAGSTRLKAGSCAKQILNMVSTCAMVRLGKTYRGLMVDVRVHNEKLRVRGRRIVRQVCQGKDLHQTTAALLDLGPQIELDDVADALIVRCGGSVKLACAVGLSGLDLPDAERRLQDAHGCLSDFVLLLENGPQMAERGHQEKQPPLFLAIDGGGTKCAVSIATAHGVVVARATTGPCNPHSASFLDVVAQIQTAVSQAVAALPASHGTAAATGLPTFSRVWAGLAGFHHMREQAAALAQALERLFGGVGCRVRLSCDTSLLSCCLDEDAETEAGIALVAGTGSVAVAFRRTASGEVVQAARTGGWGHLVGDQGSAFAIGRRALQAILSRRERHIGRDAGADAETTLEADVLRHLRCEDAADLLSTVLSPAGGSVPRLVMGSVARVVTQAAFRSEEASVEALGILDEAAEHLVALVEPLVRPGLAEPGKTVLILSGALMGVDGYRDMVLQKCRERGFQFRKIKVITDASGNAASHLSKLAREELCTNGSTFQ